jgi:hypothetical protein
VEDWSLTSIYTDRRQIKNAYDNYDTVKFKPSIGTLIYYAQQDSGSLNYAEFETTTAASSTAQTQTQEIPADLVAANKRFTELQKQSKTNFIHYNFTDENGKIIVQEVRIEIPGQKKRIFQRRPRPEITNPRNHIKSDWINNLDGIVNIPLYNIFSLESKTIFYLEGSKDVQTAKFFNIPAVTNIGGSGHISTTDFSPLCGKDVIIIPDNDAAGYNGALKVYDVLLPTDYVNLIAGQTGGVA